MKVVYFPSCVARLMGLPKGSPETLSLQEVIVALLTKANCEVIYPRKLSNLCCGLLFHSKGLMKQFRTKNDELVNELYVASNHGEYPIVCDTSPCSLIIKTDSSIELNIYDSVEFIYKFLIKRLKFSKKVEQVIVHRTCSSVKMGLNTMVVELAELCANNVITPIDVTCCGFAGDKGFTTPELNDSALVALKKQVPPNCTRGYSNSLTCEIGLSAHAGIYYRSLAYLINECTESDRACTS